MAVSPAELGIGLLFDVVPDAVIVADARTGAVVLWNRGATDVFGYSATEAVDMPVASLVPEELRERHQQGLRRFAELGTAPLAQSGGVVELPALHRDGHALWVELRLAPVPAADADGRLVLAIVRDVTERRNAHLQVAQANQALREFLSMASHDLKSPVSAISAAAQMLAESGEGAESSMLLELISRQTTFLGDLLDDFEVVARVETGQLVPVPEDVKVVELLREVVDPTIEVSGDESLVAHVDPGHLRRMVANLVANAEKYGERPIIVSAERRTGGVVVGVSDGGTGIAPADRPKLFEKFWRGQSRGSTGSGLGLAIVIGLAKANGGSAWFEQVDRPTFYIWLRPA